MADIINKDVHLGVVIDNADPEKLGRVKCFVDGIFDTGTMDMEAIPWCMKKNMGNYQSYSSMEKGAKVWVERNLDNEYEVWYWPYQEMNASTKALITGDGDEILVNRDLGGRTAALYYNNKEGFTQKIDEAKISIKSDDTIKLSNSDSGVLVKQGGVYIGDKSEENITDFAVKAKALETIFAGLNEAFKMMAEKATDPMLCPLADGLNKALEVMSNANASSFGSQNVHIS